MIPHQTTRDATYQTCTAINKATASGNRKLIEFVARTVEAAGEVTVRDGRRLINLTAISLKAQG